jgi:DNA repair protein REV1
LILAREADTDTTQCFSLVYAMAQCNYGVRFNGPYGVDHMLEGLAKEVGRRMETVAVKGAKVTLKAKQRKTGAAPALKFLGHGSCHNLSKSLDTPDGMVTRDWKVMYRLCTTLYAELGVAKEDVRGMGLTLSKLVSDDSIASDPKESKQSITNWFSGKPASREKSDLASDTNFEDAAGDVAERELSANVGESLDDEGDVIMVISSPAVSDHRGVGDPSSHTDPYESLDDTSVIVLSQEDAACEIALPPLSQIRMSQVEALPAPMRKQVESKIKSRRLLAKQSPEVAERGRFVAKQMPGGHIHGAVGKDPRFRQTDVKRMFRLAAVKSGQESVREASGESVSLTQLESLPLEMQLQVANGDDYLVGNLAREKSYDDRIDRKKAWKPNPRDSTETQGRKFEKPAPRGKPAPRPALNEGDTQPVVSVPREIVQADPRAFFRNNILPLTVFMDENPEADREAVSFVVQFLCLCVTEHGLCDVARLLRAIKNRGDAWSCAALTFVMQAVNEKVEQIHGARLDREWLFPC